jgi:glycosyltransferase involved in cell wall biosynthesis
MKISVEIITKNREKELYRCLKSLKTQTVVPFEILIIDASDRKSRYLDEFRKDLNIKYIKVAKAGYSYQRNIGLRKAKGEILAIIDDDSVAEKDWIENIVKAHKKYPKVVAIQGKIKSLPKGSIYSIVEEIRVHSWLINSMKNNYLNILTTKNISFKVTFIKKYQIFFRDDDYYNSWGNEDVDFGKNILHNQGLILFDNKIIVNHYERNNFYSYFKQQFRKGVGKAILDCNWKTKYKKSEVSKLKLLFKETKKHSLVRKNIDKLYFILLISSIRLGYLYGKYFLTNK